jgi:hypothetical protein
MQDTKYHAWLEGLDGMLRHYYEVGGRRNERTDGQID